jgi:hypothetical protein
MTFHEWYDTNLHRLIKGNLHDALQEAWQEADKQSKECITEKPEPIDCGWVAIVNGALTNFWNNPDLPEGTHKLLAVRIDDE